MHIVIAISPKHSMHLVDQLCCISPVVSIVCSPEQLEKVADCKCIGPKVSLTIPRGRTQAGSPCEFRHQSSRLGRCAIPNHFALTNMMWGADANAGNGAAPPIPFTCEMARTYKNGA